MYFAPSKEHLLGTDHQAYDIFVRLMYGGRISLTVSFLAVFLITIFGVILGGISGYFGYEWFETGALHVRPLLLAGGFSLVMGGQFISLGLLGEMMNGSKKQSYPVAESIREIVDLG